MKLLSDTGMQYLIGQILENNKDEDIEEPGLDIGSTDGNYTITIDKVGYTVDYNSDLWAYNGDVLDIPYQKSDNSLVIRFTFKNNFESPIYIDGLHYDSFLYYSSSLGYYTSIYYTTNAPNIERTLEPNGLLTIDMYFASMGQLDPSYNSAFNSDGKSLIRIAMTMFTGDAGKASRQFYLYFDLNKFRAPLQNMTNSAYDYDVKLTLNPDHK